MYTIMYIQTSTSNHLPTIATSRAVQWPLSSDPKVAVVERFNYRYWQYLCFWYHSVLPFSGSLRLDEPLNPPSPARNNHIHGSLQLAGHSKLHNVQLHSIWTVGGNVGNMQFNKLITAVAYMGTCTLERNFVESLFFFFIWCFSVDLDLL